MSLSLVCGTVQNNKCIKHSIIQIIYLATQNIIQTKLFMVFWYFEFWYYKTIWNGMEIKWIFLHV